MRAPFRVTRPAGRRSLLLIPAILATALTPASSRSAPAGRWVLAGDRVAVHNVVGTLTVLRGQGPSVVAEVVCAGQDAGRLRIATGPLRGEQTLRIVYPSDLIHVENFAGRSTFWVRDDGTLDGPAHAGRRIELTGRHGGLDARADVKLYVPDGKRVSVHWGHGSGDLRGVSAELSIDGASMDVSATETGGSLRVSVGSGTVHLSRTRGKAHVETGSGDVDARDVVVDDLTVETGSGNIQVSGVESPQLSLETGSGDIAAETVRSPHASLETGSGRAELQLMGDVDVASVESGSGDVAVSVPEGLGASVHMETGSGSIDASAPIRIKERSRHELNGTMGDGRGRLSLETGSGSVALLSERR